MLSQRYRAEAAARLSDAAVEHLDTLRDYVDSFLTQVELAERWKVSQAFISKTLGEWQNYGYVREARRDGRRLIYELTGPAKMMFTQSPGRRSKRKGARGAAA